VRGLVEEVHLQARTARAQAPSQRGTEHWAAVALLGGAMVGAALAALQSSALQRADVRIHDLVADHGGPPVDQFVVYTTDLGSVYAVVGAGATLALRGRPRTGLDIAAVGMAAWFIAQNIKHRVLRERPYEAHGVRRLIGAPTGSSFPSGHACVATAVGTVLASRSAVPGARRLFYAIASWVAMTRVYVGVHYPTDVVGGAGLGLALGALWRGPFARAVRRLLP
jgi:membrane-associated phospholipid phosphatase